MGHMVALKRTKSCILRQARYVTLPDLEHSIFLNLAKNRDVMDVVHLSHDVLLILSICSPLCGLYHGPHHLTNPNAHLICALSQPYCTPLSLFPYYPICLVHQHSTSVLTYICRPALELCTSPSTDTLSRF